MCKKGAETIESKSQYVEQSTNELCNMLLTVDPSQHKEISNSTTTPTASEADDPATKDKNTSEIGLAVFLLSFLLYII